jgi:hypothetical protein
LRNLEHQHFGFQTDSRIIVKVSPTFTGYTAERIAGTYDRPSSQRVAVVNQTFVDLYFKNQNPIGRRFGMGGPEHAADYEIAGVVEDAKYVSTHEPAYPTFFLPLLQFEKKPDGSLAASNNINDIVLHVRGARSNMDRLVRKTIDDVDANVAVLDVLSYGEQLSLQFNQERLIATLTGLFGLLALVLASVGLYGLVTLAVAVERPRSAFGLRWVLPEEESSRRSCAERSFKFAWDLQSVFL